MRQKGALEELQWLRGVSSFFPSRIILTANNYRIFDFIEGSPKTAASVSAKISADRRATELLLNSLASIGLIVKKKDRFLNSSIASKYLVTGNPDYQGDILRHQDVLWDNWSGLDEVVRTGKPFRKSRDLESFIMGMHNLALQKVSKVVPAIGLKGVKRILDLGGGPGTYSMAFAKRNIEVTLFDFPETLDIAYRLIQDAGLSKKIHLLPGDFTRDDIGSGYDLIFISQIFHAYSEKECLSMLQKSFRSLNKGGRVVIQEFYLDETKASPPAGAIFAINMLVNTPKGRSYTPNEMKSWMKKTGFSSSKTKILGDTVLVSGSKK